MAFESVEEALSFLEANRLMFEGKTGFKHYSSKLEDLKTLIEDLAQQNELLKRQLEIS